ncbi:ABC transporter permease [Propionivibrio sp.]|uniref:ABC transporter permease n=1 Tax=Propionivibrio sp. TaxID=2212460 RepID=UPI0039E36CDA
MNASGFVRRFAALLRKEVHQMLRDRSNLAVGLLLPAMLILLFGYGLSFDVKNAPVAVVMEDGSPTARQVLDGLQGSVYLSPVWMKSMPEAEARLRAGEVDGIVRVPMDFSRRLAMGDARIQLVLNGVDSNTANTLEGYVGGAVGKWAQGLADRAGGKAAGGAGVDVVQRMWFNEAGISTWYLVPGLIALVLTLIGAFLTSLLIAREWERGTLESLFVTPVRPLEVVLAKLTPYLFVGAIDIALCLLAARFLFDVPIRGSLPVIVAVSLLYLAVSLLLGLFISGKTRNQFQASQLALLTSYMPALMLSGFVFDLRNVPVAIQVVSHLLPATHFMGLVKTLFLSGNHWPTILKSAGILSLYVVVLIHATRATLRKTLD